MKKLLLLLLIVPMISFGQTKKYKVRETTPGVGIDDDIFLSRTRTYEIEDKTNPWDNPTVEKKVISQDYVPVISSPVIINNPAPLASAESNNFFPLSINIEDYTHIAVVDVINSKGSRKGISGIKRLVKALKGSELIIVDPTVNKKKFRENTFYLREIKNPKYLYLYYAAGYSGPNLTVSIVLRDSENNKVFEKSTTNLPWTTTLVEIANFTKQDQVVKNTSQPSQPRPQETNTKKKFATEEILNLKKLLDVGVITQEEFNKKAAELKKILLGN